MKNWIAAAVCLMLTASPLAFAQDKAKGDEKKAAPAAQKAEAKKEPTEKQKQQQARMRDCGEKAGAKKLKGDERKKFMSTCLKG